MESSGRGMARWWERAHIGVAHGDRSSAVSDQPDGAGMPTLLWILAGAGVWGEEHAALGACWERAGSALGREKRSARAGRDGGALKRWTRARGDKAAKVVDRRTGWRCRRRAQRRDMD